MEFAFEVSSSALSVEEISDILGLRPDGALRPGELAKEPLLPDETMWWILSGVANSDNYERQLSAMVALLADRREALVILADRDDVTLELTAKLGPLQGPEDGGSGFVVPEHFLQSSFGMNSEQTALMKEFDITLSLFTSTSDAGSEVQPQGIARPWQ